MTPFPWETALQFGLGYLKLSPHEFWRMTPIELAAAIEGATGNGRRQAPISRDQFIKLRDEFPDMNAKNQDITYGSE